MGDGDEGALVDARDARLADPLATEGDVTGHGGDAEAGLVRDALDGLGDLALGGVVRLLLLDVQILGVLPDDDHIDRLLVRADGLDRTDVGVEVELLAQGDDRGGVALDGGRRGGDGAEESTITVGLENGDGLVGQGGAGLLEGLEACLEGDEVELEVQRGRQRFEQATPGRDDFLADAITRDEAW